MESSSTYANNLTVSISTADALLIFRWVVPVFDDSFKVTGHQVAEETKISVSLNALDDMISKLNEIREKALSSDCKE